MLSGGVIVVSCAANDNGKTSSIAAVNIHFLGIILIMVTVPLLPRRLLLYPKQLDTQEKWRELAEQRAC